MKKLTIVEIVSDKPKKSYIYLQETTNKKLFIFDHYTIAIYLFYQRCRFSNNIAYCIVYSCQHLSRYEGVTTCMFFTINMKKTIRFVVVLVVVVVTFTPMTRSFVLN